MISDLKQRFKHREAQKQEFLAGLSRWSEPQLMFRREASEWSALQVLDHVVLTENQ